MRGSSAGVVVRIDATWTPLEARHPLTAADAPCLCCIGLLAAAGDLSARFERELRMNHPMPAGLDCRVWNGVEIQRRPSDGHVNATAMCKANGKRWKDYRESDRCQLYLDALESVAGISVHALVESRSGGAGGGGTWIHPQVAVDLARWISAPFAVWMDGWFLEALQLQRQPAAQVVDARPVAATTPIAMPVPPRPTVVFSAPPAWSEILETYVSEVEAEMDALPPLQRPRSRKYARPLATHFMQWLINRHAQLVIGAHGGSIQAMPIAHQPAKTPAPEPSVVPMPMPTQPRFLSGHRTEPTPPFRSGDVLAGPELARMLKIRPRTLNTWARNNPIGSIRDGWRLIGQGKVHCGALGSTVPPGCPSWLFEKA